MKRYYKRIDGRLCSTDVIAIDTRSLNEIWDGAYTAFCPIGNRYPITQSELMNEWTGISRFEFELASVGHHVPAAYL